MVASTRWILRLELGAEPRLHTNSVGPKSMNPIDVIHNPTHNELMIIDEEQEDVGRLLIVSLNDWSVNRLASANVSGPPRRFRSIHLIDENSILAVIGNDSRKLVVINRAGEVIRQIFNARCFARDFLLCTAITYRGDILTAGIWRRYDDNVSSACIQLMDWSGRIQWTWSGIANHSLHSRPTGLLELPDGGIVMSDGGLHHVVCIDPRGKIRWQYGNTGLPGRELGFSFVSGVSHAYS